MGDFPFIQGFGSAHEMNERDQPQGRMWTLKSTSKAACQAYDKRPAQKQRKVGFLARKP